MTIPKAEIDSMKFYAKIKEAFTAKAEWWSLEHPIFVSPTNAQLSIS